MKRILIALFALAGIAAFSSCGGNGRITPPSHSRKYDLNSYPGLLDAVDGLLGAKKWDEQLFDKILTSTYSNHNYEIIGYSEAFSILDAVFKGGSHYVYTAVDSTMRCQTYRNLDEWSHLSKAIAAKTVEYKVNYGGLESPNADLSKVDDMIAQYYEVKRLSQSSFRITPKAVTAYSGGYKETEDCIKSNRYWNTYFSNNIEIQQGISEFPDRLSIARGDYYMELRNLIMTRAREDNVTKSQLGEIIKRFNKITDSSKDGSSRQALAEFLMNYESNASQVESADPFWR